MLHQHFTPSSPLLLCAASHLETQLIIEAATNDEKMSSSPWQAIHFENFSVLETGVGKTNAAGAIAKELERANAANRKYGGVLVMGIAGALDERLVLGSAVLADRCILVDEGTPLASAEKDWRSLEEAGFAQVSFPVRKTEWWQELSKQVDKIGGIATVSTISGLPELAKSYRLRSQAVAEGMEGAAVAQVCARYEIDFAELRTISNICGNSNREENPWDFGKSFRRLRELVLYFCNNA